MKQKNNPVVQPLPKLEDEPLFDEAWQAETLAMADSLISNGFIEASDWSTAFGAKLDQAASNGKSDNRQTYFEAALRALQDLLVQSGSLETRDMEERTEAWRHAYLSTPHGQPVKLKN